MPLILQIEVSDDASLNVTDKNESVARNFVLRQTVPDNAVIITFNDIEVTVILYAGYLNIQVQLSPIYMGDTTGLLGNYNGDVSDEFAFRNGTVLDDLASDSEIYEFSQSCKYIASYSYR